MYISMQMVSVFASSNAGILEIKERFFLFNYNITLGGWNVGKIRDDISIVRLMVKMIFSEGWEEFI